MSHASVAVVVPVFNRAKTIIRTLTAVAQQTVLPRRVIVVDDGSSDDTAASVRDWIERTRPSFDVIIIEQTNQGAGAARNRGLREVAGCKYVAFLDSDDRWPSDFLGRAVSGMEANPMAVAISADRAYYRTRKRRVGRRSCRALKRNATAWLLANSAGIASCTLFRCSVVLRLAGFDPNLPTGQDVEFFLRVSCEGPWLHAPGNPVQFFVGFAASEGECGNLSVKYTDRLRRRVRIRERFVFRQGGAAHVSRRFYQRIFAHDWHKAASAYRSNGRHDRAIACYHKALAYRPWRVRTWMRLISLRAKLMTTGAAASSRHATLPTDTASEACALGSERLAA
jgi:glycosyltransferase involved in cell wall biosynthesis